jgi:D-alanyl-D-alanine carboxypeptidase/D-alanyl-D-alanine-endopeptidase (penicillin-binding protein 4)
VKSRVHLKSGSMNGVRCFSGYIEPSVGTKSDAIIFSIMTNNTIASTSKVDPIIDRIIAMLAAETLFPTMPSWQKNKTLLDWLHSL